MIWYKIFLVFLLLIPCVLGLRESVAFLYENGVVFTRHMFYLPKFSYISLYAPGAYNIRVYDRLGYVDFSYKNETVGVLMRSESVTVEYYSNAYTIKNRSTWVFEYYDQENLTLFLPKNIIVYKTDGEVYTENGRMVIDFKGKSGRVVYGIRLENHAHDVMGYVVIPIGVGLGFFIFIKRFKNKRIKHKKTKLLELLSENERKLVLELMNKNGITQRALRLKTGMSKATVSRTLRSLEKKKIVEIKPYGNTNMVFLRK